MKNLYLYYYEAAFLETLTKQDYRRAKKFNNMSGFIDDLGSLSSDGILVKEKEKHYKKNEKIKKNMQPCWILELMWMKIS